MTETASQVATARLDAVPPRPVMPIPGAELRVREGRIQVRGPMVSPGYVGEPDRGPGEWFDTGDLGSWDPQQGLRVLGRADDLVISGGENVMPQEVEAVLLSHPDVRQAAVAGLPDPEWGEVVAAAVVVADGTSLEDLERFLRERLAGYKVPRRWLQLPALPQVGLGKIDRQAVKRLLTQR
jgi:acyl-CoA synthetase (AMP-forming)/AMP-acid ligase II